MKQSIGTKYPVLTIVLSEDYPFAKLNTACVKMANSISITNTDYINKDYQRIERQLKLQAEHWTSIKTDRAKKGKPIVSVFDVDDALLTSANLKIRKFNGPDEAWLTFLVNNRKGV